MTNWIPVTERLPEIGEYALVTTNQRVLIAVIVENIDSTLSWILPYQFDDCPEEIYAWMPLPEPYRPIEEDVW